MRFSSSFDGFEGSYPTSWRKKFAWIPRLIQDEEGHFIWLWWEEYEERRVGDYYAERRLIGSEFISRHLVDSPG